MQLGHYSDLLRLPLQKYQTQDGWNNRSFFLNILGARESKIEVLSNLVPDDSSSWRADGQAPPGFSHGLSSLPAHGEIEPSFSLNNDY